jgi:hypothetical protein
MQGWIKIHRKLTEWEWYSNLATRALFIHLLLTVNWEDKKWHGIVIKRGSIVVGQIELSKKVGISRQQLRSSLNNLLSTNDITIQTNKHYSVISLNKYDEYQQLTNQQPTNEPSNNHPITITKEVKKERKNISSNEEIIFSHFGVLQETNPKIVELATKHDIRPKDAVYILNDMIANETMKGHEIGHPDALVAKYINNSIHWHKVKRVSDKTADEVKKPKNSEDEGWIKNTVKLRG